MTIPKCTKKEFLDAISEGVKKAIHEFMESGDGYSGVIIRDYVIEQIGNKIANSFSFNFPDDDQILNAISSNISMPNVDYVLKAIKDGIKESSNTNLEKLSDKIEYLADMIDELGMEIYKFRKDNNEKI